MFGVFDRLVLKADALGWMDLTLPIVFVVAKIQRMYVFHNNDKHNAAISIEAKGRIKRQIHGEEKSSLRWNGP